jgi:hypothetical protein
MTLSSLLKKKETVMKLLPTSVNACQPGSKFIQRSEKPQNNGWDLGSQTIIVILEEGDIVWVKHDSTRHHYMPRKYNWKCEDGGRKYAYTFD